ncbi:hypothetical protein H6776_02665 [Candidatus Nomurabacteria bacterium]|nr:hypothetical protein [Candidatus Nomurabacteria bacterium]
MKILRDIDYVNDLGMMELNQNVLKMKRFSWIVFYGLLFGFLSFIVSANRVDLSAALVISGVFSIGGMFIGNSEYQDTKNGL